MPEAVCCPKCWSWAELGKRTTCKQCGTPLVLADGRTIGEAAANPGAAPVVPVFAGADGSAAVLPTVRIRRGFDWIDIARLFTIGYGLITVLALIVIGFWAHFDVPLRDPNTGQTIVRTINLGPGFAIVAIVTGAFFALFTWLTKFAVARIIFLLLDGLTILGTLSSLGSETGLYGFLSVANLLLCIGYAIVLILTFTSRRTD